MHLLVASLIVLASAHAADTHSPGSTIGRSFAPVSKASLEEQLGALEVGDKTTVKGSKVTRVSKDSFVICEAGSDVCGQPADLKATLAKLTGGGGGPRLELKSTDASALKIPTFAGKKKKKEEREKGVPVEIHTGEQYADAYNAEKAEYLVMTYGNQALCGPCRALAGNPTKGDPTLAEEKTLKGLAAKLDGKASFYELDLKDPDLYKMYADMKLSDKMPFTVIYRRGGDGTYSRVDFGGGIEWPSKTLKVLGVLP